MVSTEVRIAWHAGLTWGALAAGSAAGCSSLGASATAFVLTPASAVSEAWTRPGSCNVNGLEHRSSQALDSGSQYKAMHKFSKSFHAYGNFRAKVNIDLFCVLFLGFLRCPSHGQTGSWSCTFRFGSLLVLGLGHSPVDCQCSAFERLHPQATALHSSAVCEGASLNTYIQSL